MNKLKIVISFLTLFLVCNSDLFGQNKEIEKINAMLDNWHKAAAEGNFNNYFGAMTDDAIFIGTDPTENWNKIQFQAFAKPYFDKGKAWDFKPLERHIYFSKDNKTAYFDELLDTWMKICRGSGVLEKIDGQWKIKHYVLSMTIPNDDIDSVIKIIAPNEDAILKKLKTKP